MKKLITVMILTYITIFCLVGCGASTEQVTRSMPGEVSARTVVEEVENNMKASIMIESTDNVQPNILSWNERVSRAKELDITIKNKYNTENVLFTMEARNERIVITIGYRFEGQLSEGVREVYENSPIPSEIETMIEQSTKDGVLNAAIIDYGSSTQTISRHGYTGNNWLVCDTDDTGATLDAKLNDRITNLIRGDE